MKRILPFFLLVAPYLLVGALISPAFAAWFNQLVGGLWIEIGMAIAILVWAGSLYAVQTGYWGEMTCAGWSMALKLCHLPVYFCLILVMVINPRYLFLMFWPLFMVVTGSGLYGIRALSLARKRDAVSKWYGLFHMIACYVPIVDTFSSVLVYFNLKRLQPAEEKP